MVKIVADSGCDLSKEAIQKYGVNIDFVPLTLQLGSMEYIDDENLNVKKYIDDMVASDCIARTAAPAPQLFLDKFKEAESVFVITLSSHLSSTYNNALIAKQMYTEEFSQIFIHVFDSLSASVGEAVIALKINEYIKCKFTDVEIVDSLNKFIKNMKTYFIIDNFNNLVKNGRMNPYIAKIASLLSIKPICEGLNGKIEIKDKARGYNKAMIKLIEIMQKEGTDFENKILGISHVGCLEKALQFKEEVMKKIKFKDIMITETAGLCSTYASKGGIIISF